MHFEADCTLFCRVYSINLIVHEAEQQPEGETEVIV